MILRMVLAVILSIASPAAAQVTAPAVAEAPDPARLAAAREVVDLSFPPTMRKSMVDQVATSILKNAQRGVEGSAGSKERCRISSRTSGADVSMFSMRVLA